MCTVSILDLLVCDVSIQGVCCEYARCVLCVYKVCAISIQGVCCEYTRCVL